MCGFSRDDPPPATDARQHRTALTTGIIDPTGRPYSARHERTRSSSCRHTVDLAPFATHAIREFAKVRESTDARYAKGSRINVLPTDPAGFAKILFLARSWKTEVSVAVS
jgi:hypothetical protein